LRIHTTIDNTACMTGANISVVWFCCYGLGSAPIRNSQLDNQLIVTDTIVPLVRLLESNPPRVPIEPNHGIDF